MKMKNKKGFKGSPKKTKIMEIEANKKKFKKKSKAKMAY